MHREIDPRRLLNISTGPNPKVADTYYRLIEFWIRFHHMQIYRYIDIEIDIYHHMIVVPLSCKNHISLKSQVS